MSYKVVKHSSGNVIAFGPDGDQYAPTVGLGQTQQTLTENELAAALAKPNIQLKTEELAALAAWRKDGMDALSRSWVDISVTGGAMELDRKALLQADITDLKSEYAAKKAEIIAKYA